MCFPCRLDGQNRAIFLLFVGILFANCLSLSAHEPGLDQDDPEYAAILSTLENYIEGSTRGKPQLLKQAFHADLNLYSIRNEKLSIWPGTEYIASTKPGVSTDEIGKVLFVDYEHDCAMAKVEILPASGPAFVDYFMLLKLEGGWQIVHKMYTRRNGRAGQKKLGQNKDLQKDASDPSTKPSAKKSHQEKQEPESLPMAKVQRINEILSQYDQPKTPGVAVGVVHQGKIVYQDSFGAANVEHATPIDPAKTLFNVGSVSKHFTGFAIAVLAEQKKLSLDDRVRKYVPELPEYCDTITIRHLANHSSGLRTSLSLLAMAGWAPGDVIRKHHILRILQRQHKLNFQPGEESSYCNSGYTLLAEIVERVSGKSFHQFCREEILEPTEMRQSGFSTGQTKFRPAMAYAYSRDSLGVFPRLPNDEYSGSTGLWTTCKDFTKWAMNVQSQRFGSEGLWRAMLTPGQLNDQTSTNYSLGLFTEEYRGLKFIHHGGATSGYVAFLGHFPENQLTIALLSNTSATNARELSLKIADVFLNATPKKPAEVTSTKPMKAVATREAMQRFVGRYWDEVDRTIEISILDGTLHYLIDGGPRIPLKAIGDAEFEMVGISGPNQLRFEKDSGGYAICIPNFKGTEGMRRLRPYEPLEMTDERLKEYVGRYYSDELDCFYTFRIEEGNLVVEHIRFNAIMLHPVVPDVFRNESWRFTTMHFERDSSGEVLGFKVHSMRNRNVSFTRIAPEAFVCGQKQSEYKDSRKSTNRAHLDFQGIDDVASSMLKEQHLPGLALVVVQDGKTILKRGFGLANIEKQTKVDPNKSLFRIGSVSKALTFLALTRLLDQGKLKRSDKIDPFVANVLNPCGFSSEITINHLLTHTAGFDQVGTGRHVYDHHLTLAERKAKRVGLDIFLKSGNLRRVTDAGEMFRYDTYGVTLAGSIIEQVTGLSYAEAMQQELFEPLGMHNSFVEVDGANLKHLALGYGWQQGQYQPRPYEVYVTTPASSIDMTPNDMGLLLEAITRDGSNDAGRLLTTSMMNRVLAPHFRAAPEFHGITHGFFESHTSLESNTQVHLRSIGHGGSMDGYRCALTIVPERKLGIFFVANRAPESGGGVVDFRPLLDLIFNQLKDAPKRKDFAIPSPATFSVPQDKLTEFIGNYYYGTFCHTPSRQDIAAGAWPRPDAISIVVLGKGLKIGEEDYRPYSEDTFVRSDGERLVRFGRNGDSVITNFVYSTSPDTFEKEMPNLPYPKRRSLAQSLLELANQQNSESTLEFLERNKASEEYYVREAEFNRLGYLLMEQGELDLAIEVFKVNSEEFPNSWNAFDSLAEGYAKLGKKELSILNYRKSLELNPRNEAGRQMLNKLRRE